MSVRINSIKSNCLAIVVKVWDQKHFLTDKFEGDRYQKVPHKLCQWVSQSVSQWSLLPLSYISRSLYFQWNVCSPIFHCAAFWSPSFVFLRIFNQDTYRTVKLLSMVRIYIHILLTWWTAASLLYDHRKSSQQEKTKPIQP